MKEVVAIVREGRVELPDSVLLPDGLVVRVVWDDETGKQQRAPLEREEFTAEDVAADLEWVNVRRFAP